MEENATKKKKQKKPRVIHALGNIKWGFVPANVRKHCGLFLVDDPNTQYLLQGMKTVEAVDTLQTKWDREHDIKLRENATFGSNVRFLSFPFFS